jgi:hypothetical protein
MNVPNIERNNSGSARSRCSDKNRAGSILLFAVIAWCSFVDFGRSLKDHAVTASHHDATLNKRGPVVHHVRGLNCGDRGWKAGYAIS